MSLRSMTGYGYGTAAGRGVLVEVELTSVNRRHLEVHVSLPPELSGLEFWVDRRIRASLSRGRITGRVTLRGAAAERAGTIRVDEGAAAAAVKILRRVARWLKLSGALSADTLVMLPGIVRFEATPVAASAVRPLLGRALDRALGALMQMREREGRALRRDIERRLARVARAVARMARRAPRVAERNRRALTRRVRTAGVRTASSDERWFREIVLAADRCEIAEELTRLRSHLAEARRWLRRPESAGRPLDFLVQEMQREVNTIGAKAGDARIAQEVVVCKTLLEDVREQVQNVE